MQCQLIENFLNLPGILGLSLMPLDDLSSHTYSVGFSQGNSPEHTPTLLHGIQQIIKTAPPLLEFCSFQFGSYRVELHKIENEAVLLVFSNGTLPDQYSRSVSELMQFIKADYSALIDSIDSIAANNLGYGSTASTKLKTASTDDVIEAMNSLSQATSRYLGTQIVANHWRSSQPQDIALVKSFRVSMDGTIGVTGVSQQLSPSQLAEIHQWAQRFHQRCSRIIRDYDVLIEQTLPEQHWQLLFGEKR